MEIKTVLAMILQRFRLDTEENFLAGRANTSDRRTGASTKYSPILDSRKAERDG